jgi:hypothetical protein
VHFKQSALIEFMLLMESLHLEFTAECRFFYGDDCVDVSTVCRWGKLGRADLCNKR